MGYIRHHAIIVTSWDDDILKQAHDYAKMKFPVVSDVMVSGMNGFCTFLIPPDGSKEGWEESDKGDDRRIDMIEWLNNHTYEDGSSSFDWAEIQYGDENGDNRILRTDDTERSAPDLPPSGNSDEITEKR